MAGRSFLRQGRIFTGTPRRHGCSTCGKGTWNADDHRLFPPKRVGVGWTINLGEVLRRLRAVQ